MIAFYYDTDEKLLEIFKEHCNLSTEQYQWIRAEFIYLVADIQDEETGSEIDKRVEKMETVFDFLLETTELTLKEHAELRKLAEAIRDSDPMIITNSGVMLD